MKTEHAISRGRPTRIKNGQIIRIGPRLFFYALAFLLATIGTAIFFRDQNYPADDVAVIIAIPITVFIILPHLIDLLVPKTTEQERAELYAILRSRPRYYRLVVNVLSVAFGVGFLLTMIGTTLLISEGVYNLVKIANISIATVAVLVLLAGVIVIVGVFLLISLLPIIFHVGRTARLIILRIAAENIRKEVHLYRGWAAN